MQEKECLYCGNLTNNPKFCGIRCSSKHHNNFKAKKQTKFCKICNIQIIPPKYSKRYCEECSANKYKPIELKCTECPRTFINRKNLPHGRHLCNSCSANRKRDQIKTRMIEYKGGECEKCGYHISNRALDFHHLDPKTKEIQLSSCRSYKWSTLQRELDKCILLCSNCHRETHDIIDSERKSTLVESNNLLPLIK